MCNITGHFPTITDLWPDKFNNELAILSEQVQVCLYSYVENGQPIANYENGQSKFGLFCKKFNVLPKLEPYLAHCYSVLFMCTKLSPCMDANLYTSRPYSQAIRWVGSLRTKSGPSFV